MTILTVNNKHKLGGGMARLPGRSTAGLAAHAPAGIVQAAGSLRQRQRGEGGAGVAAAGAARQVRVVERG